MKLHRKKDCNDLHQVCVWWADRKNKIAPRPLIGWDIFDRWKEFKKIDRKQDLEVLNQVCLFRADGKNKMAALASDWLGHFYFSSETAERNSMKIDRKQDLEVLNQVCLFRADGKNKMAALASDWLGHFYFSSETAERNSMKLDRKQDLNVLYRVCVFRTGRKNKMTALASDWCKIFDLFSEPFERILTKLDRKKDLDVLYQVHLFWLIGKIRCLLSLWLAGTFSNSPLKPLNGIHRNLIGSKIPTSSTKCMLFGPIGKLRWPPRPLIEWNILDFSPETADRNSPKLDRKQDSNVLYQVCAFQIDRKNKMAALTNS